MFYRQNKYKELKSMSDEELYNLVSDKIKVSETAFSVLYDRHSAETWKYCLETAGDEDLARDIFQETFIRFYDSIDRSRVINNLQDFICNIANNIFAKHSSKKKISYVEFDESLFTNYETEDNSELLDLIHKAIDQLPEDYRSFIVMREYQNMSYQDIADLTGETLANVKVRIFRAKSKVKDILHAYIKDLKRQKVTV